MRTSLSPRATGSIPTERGAAVDAGALPRREQEARTSGGEGRGDGGGVGGGSVAGGAAVHASRCRRVRNGLLLLLFAGPVGAALSLASPVLAEVVTNGGLVAGWVMVVTGLATFEQAAEARRVVVWWEATVALWVAAAALTVLSQGLAEAGVLGAVTTPAGSSVGPAEAGVWGPQLVLSAVTTAAQVGALLATSRLLLELMAGREPLQRTWTTSGRLVRWLLIPGSVVAVVATPWVPVVLLGDAPGALGALVGLGSVVVLLATLIPEIHVIVSMHRTFRTAAGRDRTFRTAAGRDRPSGTGTVAEPERVGAASR